MITAEEFIPRFADGPPPRTAKVSTLAELLALDFVRGSACGLHIRWVVDNFETYGTCLWSEYGGGCEGVYYYAPVALLTGKFKEIRSLGLPRMPPVVSPGLAVAQQTI